MSHQFGGVNRPARTTGSALGAHHMGGHAAAVQGGQTKGVVNATDHDHVAPSHRRRPRGPRVPDSRDGLQLLLERRRRERRVRGRLHRGLGSGFRSERSRSGRVNLGRAHGQDGRRLAHPQDAQQPVLRVACRRTRRRRRRRTTSSSPSPPASRTATPSRQITRHRQRDLPRRQGHPHHDQRRRRQRGAQPGQEGRAVRDRARHPAQPAETVDITYATDNEQAGKLDGQYAAAKLDGKKAVIAMLDLFNDQVVSVDIHRDHGFLEGMGIDPGSKTQNGKEAKTGQVLRRQAGLHDRLPPADPGRDRRRPHGDGELPVGEPGHQRRLHDQRAGRRGCVQRAEGRRQDRTTSSSSRSTAAATASKSSRAASSPPTRRSTRARWQPSASTAIAKLARGGQKPTPTVRQGLLRHRHGARNGQARRRRHQQTSDDACEDLLGLTGMTHHDGHRGHRASAEDARRQRAPRTLSASASTTVLHRYPGAQPGHRAGSWRYRVQPRSATASCGRRTSRLIAPAGRRRRARWPSGRR